jgi:hypothetical protein
VYTILQNHKASLQVLHITNQPEALNMSQQDNKDLLMDYFSNFETKFHNLTHRKVEDAIEFFVKSRDIKMVAMVAKNLNYFQRVLFHSKVEEITYHTRVPFLVLHDK